MIISVEPMESLRYIPMLSAQGWLITNINPYVNIPNYPEIGEVYDAIKSYQNHIAVDAEKLAAEAGARRSANMVILGAASLFIGFDSERFEKAIANFFQSKGEDVVRVNLAALFAGRSFAEKYIKN
jgi:indolepyruvate ferredoxin oxidoreductase beta subunit